MQQPAPRDAQQPEPIDQVAHRGRSDDALGQIEAQKAAIVLESMTDGFVSLDREWRFTLVNRRAETMMGRPASELLGRSLEDVLPDLPAWPYYHQVAETRRPVEFEIWSPVLDAWLEVHAFPTSEGIAVLFTDVTQRKEAEDALRESRHDLARAQELAHVGSWTLNTRTNELVWSDETYRMFGIPLGEALSYGSFLATVHPEDRDFVNDRWSAALNGDGYDIEHRIVVDGSVKWVREHAILEFDDAGELLGGFGIVADITRRRLAEIELEKRNREIETANELLELFLSERGDALFDKALDILLAATGSEFGVFGYIDEEGDLVCPTMSRMMEECEMDESDKCIVYKQHKWSGLWGRALHERATLVCNDEAAVPSGHVPIHNNLSAAIVFNDGPIGLINLADTGGGYSEDERLFVEGVACRIAPVLYAWVQRRLREEERDRTAAERHERLSLNEALNEITAAATSTFDENEILGILTHLGGKALAVDSSAVVLRQHDSWVLKTCEGAVPVELGAVFTDERLGIVGPLVAESHPIALEDIEPSQGKLGDVIASYGVKSLLSVPLIAGGEVFGTAVYSHVGEARRFTAGQLEFATKLMNVATVSVESARTYQREHRIAEALQEAILAPPSPIVGIEMGYVYQAASSVASIGGDFYDVFTVDDEHVAVLIGDVSGKGLRAARLTTLLRDGAKAYMLERRDTGKAMSLLNMLVYASTSVDSFATVFVGTVSMSEPKLEFCGAGHPAAMMLRSDRLDLLSPSSPILGAFDEAAFACAETGFGVGDVLILYTDGVPEARNAAGEFFGETRMVEAAARLRGTPAADLPQRLMDAVLEFSGGRLRDDTIILCVARSADPGV
ncbi:MAG: SpoIIE family protein phosphatase [Coriobacteriales bacterium]|nr:SpoIIE family protein phosphatase [Coriobacteriales bacterium]